MYGPPAPVTSVSTPSVRLMRTKPNGQGRYLFDATTRRIFAEYILLRTNSTKPGEMPDHHEALVQELMESPDDVYPEGLHAEEDGLMVAEAFGNLKARHWT